LLRALCVLFEALELHALSSHVTCSTVEESWVRTMSSGDFAGYSAQGLLRAQVRSTGPCDVCREIAGRRSLIEKSER